MKMPFINHLHCFCNIVRQESMYRSFFITPFLSRATHLRTFLTVSKSNSITQVKRSLAKKKLLNSRLQLWSHKACSNLAFVPKHGPCPDKLLEKLQDFINEATRIFVLTGAGISTESGIPDYRSEGVGLYATSEKRPVQFKDFVNKAAVRQSYWARNYVGWPKFSSFKPNITHVTLADWEKQGKVCHIVTQNVDALHQKAGSVEVTELHGSAHMVHCMHCSYRIRRAEMQPLLTSLNPHLLHLSSQQIRPDGDVELSKDAVAKFVVPPCPDCGGILKPYVVFFGDNVPRSRVEAVKEELRRCDALLALGTSLHVYSAYRFILLAAELGLPMAAVNIGATRGDALLRVRVPARCGHVLPLLRLARDARTAA